MRHLKRKTAALLCSFSGHGAVLFVFPLWFVGQIFICVCLFAFTQVKRGGIRLSSVDDNEIFFEVTSEALALIETCDPRRHAILQKQLKFISNTPVTRRACYDRSFRCCRVNFDRLGFDWKNRAAPDYELHRIWHTASYAALLVHEATHGRLFDMGIPYTRQTYRRVERICQSEARRFAAHLPRKQYDFARDLVPPFDSSYWDALWNTPYKARVRSEYRRAMTQIWEKKPKTSPCL